MTLKASSISLQGTVSQFGQALRAASSLYEPKVPWTIKIICRQKEIPRISSRCSFFLFFNAYEATEHSQRTASTLNEMRTLDPFPGVEGSDADNGPASRKNNFIKNGPAIKKTFS